MGYSGHFFVKMTKTLANLNLSSIRKLANATQGYLFRIVTQAQLCGFADIGVDLRLFYAVQPR